MQMIGSFLATLTFYSLLGVSVLSLLVSCLPQKPLYPFYSLLGVSIWEALRCPKCGGVLAFYSLLGVSIIEDYRVNTLGLREFPFLLPFGSFLLHQKVAVDMSCQ